MRKTHTITVGMRFGKLEVTHVNVGKTAAGKVLHTCKCDCGTVRDYVHGNLAQGLSKSCGCSSVERAKAGLLARTHGLSSTSEWLAHKNMMDRCYNEKAVGYHRYGGRGIAVCERWRGHGGFERFYADVGLKPDGEARYTLGRIDNDGNYEPDNVRWETYREQGANQSTNRRITLDGETRTLSEWARLLGGSVEALSRRLDAYEWEIAEALSTRVKTYRGKITFEGKTMTASEWSRHLGMPVDTVRARLKDGWTIERAITTPHKPRKKG